MPRQFPKPSQHLSSRIGGRDADYETIGAWHAAKLTSLLPPKWEWAGKRVLDFGCGTGRTLVQFADQAEAAEFWGCDIDEPSIAWAQQNLSPPLNFVANGELPPVDLPAGSFDLVYGFSVFTHLLETWAPWLLEMHRLLQVGGYGVFTFLGEGMVGDIIGRAWDSSRIGMIELDAGRPWSIGGPNALHSEWWLSAHWGRLFDVVQVLPAFDEASRTGHGLIVVRKDDRTAPTVDDLLALEQGELREVASLQFNVELLKEQVASLWSAEAGTVTVERDHLRTEVATMKESKSWKLTKPLRWLRARGSRG